MAKQNLSPRLSLKQALTQKIRFEMHGIKDEDVETIYIEDGEAFIREIQESCPCPKCGSAELNLAHCSLCRDIEADNLRDEQEQERESAMVEELAETALMLQPELYASRAN